MYQNDVGYNQEDATGSAEARYGKYKEAHTSLDALVQEDNA